VDIQRGVGGGLTWLQAARLGNKLIKPAKPDRELISSNLGNPGSKTDLAQHHRLSLRCLTATRLLSSSVALYTCPVGALAHGVCRRAVRRERQPPDDETQSHLCSKRCAIKDKARAEL
jgi:hypothetical protein